MLISREISYLMNFILILELDNEGELYELYMALFRKFAR